jgi:hypothetical protein
MAGSIFHLGINEVAGDGGGMMETIVSFLKVYT